MQFTGVTTADEPADQVLEKAKEWGCDRVVILGLTPDGRMVWGGSISDVPLINLMLDHAKADLLAQTAGFDSAS